MRKGIYYILLILFFIAVGPLAEKAMAGQLDDLATRVEVNEARLDDTEDSFKSIMDISGYADVMYIATDQGGQVNRFRVHHLSLQFSKQLGENWSFFSEVEFEDGTLLEGDNGTGLEEAQGAVVVETMYFDTEVNEYLNLRIGRYLDPAGIWNVDHYVPFVPTMQRPQHIRKIFPKWLDGVQAFGSRPVGGNYLSEYKVYIGNGSGEPGKTDSNEDKGVGGSLNIKFLSFYDLDIGLSIYTEEDNASNYDVDAQGFDVKFRVKDLKFQAEYAKADRQDASSVITERSGWYGQFIYDIGKLSLVYRYDTYEDTELATDKETVYNTAAVNYRFTPNVVGKLENHWIEPENSEEYYKTVFTVAIFLGG